MTAFITSHKLTVEANVRRISSGDATHIQRYDRILAPLLSRRSRKGGDTPGVGPLPGQ